MRGFMLFVSLLLVVIALMLLGADLVTSLEMRDQITVRTVGDIWALFDAPGPKALHDWGAGLWSPVLPAIIDFCLGIYSWLVPGVLGVALAFLFGRRHEG